MSAPAKIQQEFDESFINFFDEQMVGHADTVYRMAYTLTLSLDTALQLVKQTYQRLVPNLATLQSAGEQASLPTLLTTLWQCYSELGQVRTPELTSPLGKVLKSLAVEARAALVAVDVAGLGPAEAARVFAWSETDLRQKLAGARRVLLTSNLS